MTRTFLNNAISCKFDKYWRVWLWNVLPIFRINYNKVLYLLSVDVRPGKWSFPSKFDNGVVSTTIKPEQPGPSLRKPQEKSQCRRGGFLTVAYIDLPHQSRNFNSVLFITNCCHSQLSAHIHSNRVYLQNSNCILEMSAVTYFKGKHRRCWGIQFSNFKRGNFRIGVIFVLFANLDLSLEVLPLEHHNVIGTRIQAKIDLTRGNCRHA